MSDEDISKLMNLDSIYFLSSIFLLLLINSDRNMLDALYLIVITFYYVRLKVHRYKKSHNASL